MIRSGNPALRGNIFTSGALTEAQGTMTIRGTVNRTLLLLMLTVLSAGWVWSNAATLMSLVMPAAILGFIVALVTIFKKEWSAITAPIYALLEGVFLGGISAVFESAYPGIVIQAVMLTFGVLFCLLMAYKSGVIKATENFKLGVVASTGSVALIYIVTIILGFLGVRVPFIHDSGPIGIGFSLVVVVIASLNLVIDFDFIESGEARGAPKYMEWYGAFGLMVTLIWLYLEMLRLLSKVRSR